MQIGALSTASNMDANGTEYTVLPMPSSMALADFFFRKHLGHSQNRKES